ncbi:hypothetical protein DPMN_173163 [Dreissena polymorpha]|uniref:Uncharacterized protein n=1 Tax=Dreissena polymorpha TaxID=45954 RepID=A0A9D4E128_DREPO|nr:hypothetical protein DPMN_173163 [Dreissena polymorpha]
MVASAESGDFRVLQGLPPRTSRDKGVFTVQTSSTPRRRRVDPSAKGQQQQPLSTRNVRLTPIHENEEMTREGTPMSLGSDGEQATSPSSFEVFERDSSTGMGYRTSSEKAMGIPLRKSCIPRLVLDSDTYEEELEHISEDTNNNTYTHNVVSDLPPRPSCKRKVLPPSVTGPDCDNVKSKNKLLKLRNKPSANNFVLKDDLTILKDLQKVILSRTERLNTLKVRPRSAENRSRVIHLADLSSPNRVSVPDLPSIIQSITRHNELHSQRTPVSTEPRDLGRHEIAFDESGALSTPREEALMPTPLRSKEMASFYNMWDRDTKKRPFDKKDCEKERGIHFNRSCLCSLRNCGRKCGFPARSNVLPPIVSPHREL